MKCALLPPPRRGFCLAYLFARRLPRVPPSLTRVDWIATNQVPPPEIILNYQTNTTLIVLTYHELATELGYRTSPIDVEDCAEMLCGRRTM